MSKISLSKSSSRTHPKMSSSVSNRQHSFPSQFVMSMVIVICLVGFCPYVSSSSPSVDQNNKVNYDSNGFMLDPTDYHGAPTGESSLSPAVRRLFSRSPSVRYIQPRTRANQFLLSHIDDDEIVVPKWFIRYNNDQINNIYNDDDDDDLFDYVPSSMLFRKRSKVHNNGGFSQINKRKQGTKPPMEVMNEIVNSIYLKR